MKPPVGNKKSKTWRLGVLTLGLSICLGPALLRETGIISTRKFEIEVLNFDWNFREILDYIDAEYPDEAVDIGYESDHNPRTFFIKLNFKAPPDGAIKFAESICDSVLYQGYDPFDTIDSGQPVMGAKLIPDSGGSYYSYSPNVAQDLLGNRCKLAIDSAKWEHIRVDTSHADLYEVRYEIPSGGLSPRYSPQLFFDENTPLWQVEYINPTAQFPFMILGLMETNGQYFLVGEMLCFEIRWDFENWKDHPRGLPTNIYSLRLIGTKVVILIDNAIVIDSTISDRWTLSHLNQKNADFDLLFNFCVFQKHWQQGPHEITLRVDAPEILEESWTFLVE